MGPEEYKEIREKLALTQGGLAARLETTIPDRPRYA